MQFQIDYSDKLEQSFLTNKNGQARQLSENRTTTDRRPIDDSFQGVDRSPVLFSGLSHNVEIANLVASLPSRSVADKLVDVCFESHQPSLSMLRLVRITVSQTNLVDTVMIHVPTFKIQVSY